MPPSFRALRTVPEPSDDPRWHQLLDRLDSDALTETFLSLIGAVPGYDPPPVPLAELRRTGRLSFEALVAGLRGASLPAPIAAADDVGISRARAGIPLTSLMTAIRLDFTVLWEALTAVAEDTDAELLVRHTGIVLHIVDEYAGQTQRAYVAERQRMRDEESSVRQGLIAALFQSPPPTGDRLRAIGDELGIAADAPLLVAAAAADDTPALRVFVAEVERAGVTVFTHHLGETLVVFTRRPRRSPARFADPERRLRELRVGLVFAETGLPGLRDAAATAGELARLLVADEQAAMTWERGWARVAKRRLLASGQPVLADVQTALDGCGEAERTRLEEAARSYLETGSVGASAAALFCHRNTLANRLRRFAELTGVDPLVPEQAARLVVGWA